MTSTPWHRSVKGIVLASILFPPLGLILLWRRPGFDPQKKIAGSVAILAVGAAYLAVIFTSGFVPSPFIARPEDEAHFAELERHRAQQRESAGGAPTPTSAEAQPATAAEEAKTGLPPVEAAASTPAAVSSRNYWTTFRGPAMDGRYDEQKVAGNWASQAPPLMWRQPVGGGYASFVIAEGRAYTIEQRRGQEVVAAYDVETGRELWTHGWDAAFIESMGGDGPRATPTWDSGRLYALGATGELRCLEAGTGKRMWSHNILTDNQAQNIDWGMSASPLIVDDKVIVLPGGTSGKSVVAYNKMTGQPVWRSLNDKAGYTSPMLVTLAGKRQILVFSASRLMGVAIEDGALLWDYPWQTSYGVNASQPIIVDKSRVFISTGYGKGAALIEVTGDGNGFSARKVWENTTMKNKFNSSVLRDGYVYGLDEGIMTCVDVETGERKWKGGRYGYGQIILAGDNLIVITDTGDLVLVKATPDQHAELGSFSAIEGKTWNYPAIAGGRLLVRNANQMACYNIASR